MTTRLQRTRDGSRTLYSDRYEQAYGSQHGALTEAREVFLTLSGTGARLAAGGAARVLEVGFGTGLNFFLSARAALATPGARLHYAALEHDLLSAAEVVALGYGALLEVEALVTAYGAWRKALSPATSPLSPTPTPQRFSFAGSEGTGVTLELHLGDAVATAASGALSGAVYDAIYQDPFSPSANPELWTPSFLGALTTFLAPGGALTSYCVKGEVRRRLSALGLEVARHPGPVGGKREVLLARKPTPSPHPAPS